MEGKGDAMLKRIFISILLVSCLCFQAMFVNAFTLDLAFVFRDKIVHEAGVFTGVQDQDGMKATAQLSGVIDPKERPKCK